MILQFSYCYPHDNLLFAVADSWGSKRGSFWWLGRGPTAAYRKKEVSGLICMLLLISGCLFYTTLNVFHLMFQGTNDCFVFTNVDGCPVICHPTGNLFLISLLL